MNLSKLNPLNWFKKTTSQAQQPAAPPMSSSPTMTWNEHPLMQWHRDAEQLFDQLWQRFELPARPLKAAHSLDRSDPERYRWSVDMQGFDERDIHLSVSGNRLTIRAEKNEQQSRDGWRQLNTRQFVQRFTLPRDAEAQNIDAQWENGTLNINISRNAALAQQNRSIPIEVKH